MAAEQAKDRGNKAFSAGNYQEAIASFSEAIALHEKALANKETPGGKLFVYYSNRSASYLKLHDGKNALLDAEKCISIKKDWAKGYSRKGAALHQLGRFPDAYRAYKDGLVYDASNAALMEGLRTVEKMMTASTPPPSSSSSSSSSSRPSASNKTLKQFVMGDASSSFQSFQFVLRSLMVVLFVLYWFPFVLPAYVAYGNLFKLALVNHLSYLAFTHGVPKLQAAYAQRLVLDPTTQSFFFCLIFWTSAPNSLALIPVMLIELVHFAAYGSSLLQVVKLQDHWLVQNVTTRVAYPVASFLLQDPSFATLPTQSKWAKLYHRMPQVAANIEVGLGLALILELVTPARNFLLTILYWQLLRVRYMISPQLQEAFRSLNQSILVVVNHPRCPQAIGRLYAKIQKLAHSMTDMNQAQQTAQARPRCSIM